MGEADHREPVALHGQVFNLRDDGGGGAIGDVFELAAQVGAGMLLGGLADRLRQAGVERLGGGRNRMPKR